MSYQVLARKWRPANFKQMAGQEHVLQTLINALDNDRLHHAYLFTGTRGVGKTTIARILAKCLNCEQGVSSEPCGECSACKEIAEGRFIDLIEVDAASRTKVEDTRELLDNVQYAPTRGRFKVYLIDEVHMLSGHSFNALLKTLEEPPAHVKFLLATTDPQKLPVTILSRCLQFNLKNLSPERIVKYLQEVLEKEQIPVEESALWSLARSADGSMRDALSLTDQAIAHGAGKISESEVTAMLGTVDLSMVQDIAKALANQDQQEVFALVAMLAEHAPDYISGISELLSLWHKVAVYQVVPEGVDNSCGDLATVTELARILSKEDVQLFYQICLLGRKDIPLAPDPRTGFEMTLLRLLAFRPVANASIDPPEASIEPLQQEEVTAKKPEAAVAASEEPTQEPSNPEPEVEPEPLPDYEVYPDSTERLVDAPVREAPPVTEGITSTEEVTPAPMPDVESLAIDSVNNDESAEKLELEQPLTEEVAGKISLEALHSNNWITVFEQIAIGGVLQNTAANLVLIEKSNSLLRFHLDKDYSPLYEQGHQARLAEVLGDYFDAHITVEIEVTEVTEETPQGYRERQARELRAEALEILHSDPTIKLLEKTFGAELIESSVKPIK